MGPRLREDDGPTIPENLTYERKKILCLHSS